LVHLYFSFLAHQVRQAETQREAMDGAVTARMPKTYQWWLVPTQSTPQAKVEWQAIRLQSSDPLAMRASKKLKSEELLITNYGPTVLQRVMNQIPLWRENHVSVRQIVEDFSRYIYLPRMKDPSVLVTAIREGVALITWETESFAYADSYDDEAKRYCGLRGGRSISLADSDSSALLVKPGVARKQMDAEVPTPGPGPGPGPDSTGTEPKSAGPEPQPPAPPQPKRYHGTVVLNPARVGRDASIVAEEVIAHLAGLIGAKVKVTLEVEAEVPSGVADNVVRTVTENSQALKFTSHGFERE
jgi:hypothetical protein